MNRDPRQETLQLYTDTMQEIFTAEEQAQIVIETRSRMLDLHGPEHLKKRLSEAVIKKMKGN